MLDSFVLSTLNHMLDRTTQGLLDSLVHSPYKEEFLKMAFLNEIEQCGWLFCEKGYEFGPAAYIVGGAIATSVAIEGAAVLLGGSAVLLAGTGRFIEGVGNGLGALCFSNWRSRPRQENRDVTETEQQPSQSLRLPA